MKNTKPSVKITPKEKRRQNSNVQSSNIGRTDGPKNKDIKKSDVSSDGGKQCHKHNISKLRKIDICHMAKENINSKHEIVNLQNKIIDLTNQRDDLIKYHKMITCPNQAEPLFLQSEIADLKNTVGSLQRGLDIILGEYAVIKNGMSEQIKIADNTRKREAEKENPMHLCSVCDGPEKRAFSLGNGDYNLLKNSNVHQNLCGFGQKTTESINLNNGSNKYYRTTREHDHLETMNKKDSMDMFRQLAEIKIITEILQKYSSIVIDEFRNLNNDISTQSKLSNDILVAESLQGCFVGIPKSSKIHDHLLQDNYIHHQELLDLQLMANDFMKYEDDLITPYRVVPGYCSGNTSTLLDPLNLKEQVVNLKTNVKTLQENLTSVLNECESGRESVGEGFVVSSNSAEEYKLPRGELEEISSNLGTCRELNWKTKGLRSDIQMISSRSLTFCYQSGKKLKKKTILFLSDYHGRHCPQYLQDELGTEFSVASVVKPDALFEEIVSEFQHLTSSFSRDDYVIVFAGSNNLKCKSSNYIKLDTILPLLEHTNVIFPSIPLLFDCPSINPIIRRVNTENNRKIFELAKKNSNILPMPKFTFFSRDDPKHSLCFNKIGKKRLCKLIAKTIIYHVTRKTQGSCLVSSNKNMSQASLINLPQPGNNQIIININEPHQTSTVSATDLDQTMLEESSSFWKNDDYVQHWNKSKQEQTDCKSQNDVQTQKNHEVLEENLQHMSVFNNLNVNPTLQSQSIVMKNGQINSIIQPTTTDDQYQIRDFPHDERSKLPHQHQGFFAGIFMKNNHSNMTTIKELLGQGDVPKPRKNFIKENVRMLKEMKLEKPNKLNSQRSKNLEPLTERRNAQTMVSSSRLGQRHSVSGRPVSQQSPSPPARNRRLGVTNRHVTLDTREPIIEEVESPKGYRSQGCQTLNGKQLEHLYDEGVIRYPSVRETEKEEKCRMLREMGLQTETALEVIHPSPSNTHYQAATPQADEGLHWDEEKKAGDKDHVKMNATIPDPRRHKTPDPSSSSVDPTRAPPTYQRGVVPKYLREHKKEIEKERINKAKDDECPEGHIQLPDDIKMKHLNTLKQNYSELVSQLNQLPVSTDTLRTRTRKKQIESDLDRIEAAIALFSREKVFVKADS